MDIQSLAAVPDADLLARAKRLARNECQATAALIAHLAEIEARKLYLDEACSSLFSYCMRVLHLSEPASYNRIQAARAARRFPAVLASLEQGLVHLAAVRLLAPVLTPENHREMLAAAAHKSKREVEELVARLRPQPDVPAAIRKLPGRSAAASLFENAQSPRPVIQEGPVTGAGVNPKPAVEAVAQAPTAGAEQPVPADEGPAAAVRPSNPALPCVVVPLTAERYKVQFTVSAATRDKLRRAQELLRHRVPSGDVGQVMELALDHLVRELEKQKFAATSRPRRSERAPDASSRHVPAAVRRAVWERDRGQCAFVNAAGERCVERGALEFDHIRPHADGGGAELQNVRLLCRQHNQHEARQFFGRWESDAAQPLAAGWP